MQKMVEDFAFDVMPHANYMEPASIVTVWNAVGQLAIDELRRHGRVVLPGIGTLKRTGSRLTAIPSSSLKAYFKAYAATEPEKGA